MLITFRNSLLLLSLFVFQFGFGQKIERLPLRKYKITVLSDSLRENSGLEIFQDKMYTFNDGGNTSQLFEISAETGNIARKHSTGLKNTDWEAITSDSANFYIADFGNNAGRRKDLAIYKIPVDSLGKTSNKESTSKIAFFYPEQIKFDTQNINTNFDAESLIYLNGKLHIFTKEWLSKSTTHYVVDPYNLDIQAAEKLESFAINYVATDATYFKGKLYIVGYTKQAKVFLTVFDESDPGIFFSKEPKKYLLGSSLKIGQIEGITANENGLFISGEEFNLKVIKVKPSLYFIPFSKIK